MLRNLFVFAAVLLPLSVVFIVDGQSGAGPILDPISKLAGNGEVLFLVGLLAGLVALTLRNQAKRIAQLEDRLAER